MYEINTLENGIKIVSENISFVRSISFGIWVKVGSQNEDLNLNGISHFIEHMILLSMKNLISFGRVFQVRNLMF